MAKPKNATVFLLALIVFLSFSFLLKLILLLDEVKEDFGLFLILEFVFLGVVFFILLNKFCMLVIPFNDFFGFKEFLGN